VRGASAIACADIQHGSAAGRDFGGDQAIDGIEVCPALVRQARVGWRNAVVGGDGIE
jgi:hypothetical protein